MTNDDSSLAENGGEEDGGGLPTVSGVKASFILHAPCWLCACWFKKIIKDIFVVLMSLPSTFCPAEPNGKGGGEGGVGLTNQESKHRVGCSCVRASSWPHVLMSARLS